MTAGDVVRIHAAISNLWPPRLVDPLTEDSARTVAAMMPPAATLQHGLVVVDEFFRRGSPFPPSWPEVAARWQAHAAGVPDDLELIAGEWLARLESCSFLYGGPPAGLDPIVVAAVEQASGSWQAWGMTPTGGVGDGGAFVRNEVPARNDRFRRAAVAMLRHRAATGDALPQIIARRQQRLDGGDFRRALEAARVEVTDDP